ncbi:MAG TPA: glycosyl hydrolase, partial [Steroidobacteraceae bacterium]|nr:glycosyl hydrolase [Steroidobacteraceae bacterium]
MKSRSWLFALLIAPLGATLVAQERADVWPQITRDAKPWTRWWWPGSAVDKAHLTAQLEAIAAAGIGGVEITPIYGPRGSEARYVEFLSPKWMEMIEHTTREAERLGLGVDMATGTGWPFGGPAVGAADGSSSLALLDGNLTGKPTAMKVKRPAPGGEGLVLDPYSTGALDRYLRPFSKAFVEFPRDGLRAQFHDSFEYYNASWTATLPEVFQKMHGYDIQSVATAFADVHALDEDTLGRVKGDYRRTLAKLHLDYVNAWVTWAHEEGFKARNQAHGAPGNLLDLYGTADIPETESFGLTDLPIVGLRGDSVGVSIDPDPPGVTIGRFASSAAHVMGRPLVSSETLTWLRENFRESPAAAKPQLDRLFAAGINHIFY